MKNLREKLAGVVNRPQLFTESFILKTGEKIVVRPLVPEDVEKLAIFLGGLSGKTREQSTFSSYDIEMAKELCEAINLYDKLRLVLENSKFEVCGLFEFSFDIPDSDVERYKTYGVILGDEDCRWGITIADDYQNIGVGNLVFSFMEKIARSFGNKRIILYGGVLESNNRAINYYKRHGFVEVGKFVNQDSTPCIDMVLDL